MKWKERGMVSMINKDYFKYLIKQNKKYLILIYVVGIIIPFLTLNSLMDLHYHVLYLFIYFLFYKKRKVIFFTFPYQ